MLLAHAIFLKQATHLEISKPESTEQAQLVDLTVYKQDLRQGKAVVRTVDREEKITYTNVRHLMENMTLPDLYDHEVGLCSSTSPTSTPKVLT